MTLVGGGPCGVPPADDGLDGDPAVGQDLDQRGRGNGLQVIGCP